LLVARRVVAVHPVLKAVVAHPVLKGVVACHVLKAVVACHALKGVQQVLVVMAVLFRELLANCWKLYGGNYEP
jgi:hypothetical protein